MLITTPALAVVAVERVRPSAIWPTQARPPVGAPGANANAADRSAGAGASTATSARRSSATTRAGTPPAVTATLPRTAWATVTTSPPHTHPVARALTARQPV